MPRKRRKPKRPPKPPLTISQILEWADYFHAATGEWPKTSSGEVAAEPINTWSAINQALIKGVRGLPGGSSLPRLLAEHRGVRNKKALPLLTTQQILKWCDAFHEKTGTWPTSQDGELESVPGETWRHIDNALRHGSRGLPCSSLAQLLEESRGVRNVQDLLPLTEEQILVWVDAFFEQHEKWPNSLSGAIEGTTGETWHNLDAALMQGLRGFDGGDSLAKLIARNRRARTRGFVPDLTITQILKWVDDFHRRTGKWPNLHSGWIEDPDWPRPETWNALNAALEKGSRSLPGGCSLARLVTENRRT